MEADHSLDKVAQNINMAEDVSFPNYSITVR